MKVGDGQARSGGPLSTDGHGVSEEATLRLPLSTSSFLLPPSLFCVGIRLLSAHLSLPPRAWLSPTEPQKWVIG